MKKITELIGNTPLLKLKGVENCYGKLEMFNLTGSIKDRAALKMLEVAKEEGKINEDTLIIEPTSGNTGIALACLGKYFNYKVNIVMPENMSKERISLMKVYGAEVSLTSKEKGMAGAIEYAQDLANKNENSWIPMQFENKANALAHYLSTGPEIYKQCPDIDIFVVAVGTGGTLTGIGRYLKEVKPNVKIVAVEPSSSAVLSGKEKGAHKIQGIGAGFIPGVLDTSLIDEIMTISDEESYSNTQEIALKENVFAGISSGANYCALKKLHNKYPEAKIVTVFPDSGDRYLSSGVFS